MPQRSSADPGLVTPAEKPPLVFLGPTLSRREASSLLPASFRPPVRRGDVYRALADGFTTLVLIDGEFHGTPSVWQREIADALTEGATVHGASSMGAIRAAELHTFGMIGHGKIFEWYRDGVIVADDEVALGYGPSEFGYPPLSEPLVNIRATMEAAPPGVISPEECGQLIEFSKALYYPERSFAALLERGPVANWPAERRDRLARFLRDGRIDQKREDAVVALTAVAAQGFRRCLSKNVPEPGKPWRRERLVAEGMIPPGEWNAAEIARRAGLSESELAVFRHELSALFFVALWGEEHGLVATPADLERQRAFFSAATVIPGPRRDGLLASRALADAAVRSFSTAHPGRNSNSSTRAIILDWALGHSIQCDGCEGEALAEWVIESSPKHFGYKWAFDDELTETMWLLGRLARFQPREVT